MILSAEKLTIAIDGHLLKWGAVYVFGGGGGGVVGRNATYIGTKHSINLRTHR